MEGGPKEDRSWLSSAKEPGTLRTQESAAPGLYLGTLPLGGEAWRMGWHQAAVPTASGGHRVQSLHPLP